jgi:hypothetical protein
MVGVVAWNMYVAGSEATRGPIGMYTAWAD